MAFRFSGRLKVTEAMPSLSISTATPV